MFYFRSAYHGEFLGSETAWARHEVRGHTWAVESLLDRIPVHQATQVGADGMEDVLPVVFITVSCHL